MPRMQSGKQASCDQTATEALISEKWISQGAIAWKAAQLPQIRPYTAWVSGLVSLSPNGGRMTFCGGNWKVKSARQIRKLKESDISVQSDTKNVYHLPLPQPPYLTTSAHDNNNRVTLTSEPSTLFRSRSVLVLYASKRNKEPTYTIVLNFSVTGSILSMLMFVEAMP